MVIICIEKNYVLRESCNMDILYNIVNGDDCTWVVNFRQAKKIYNEFIKQYFHAEIYAVIFVGSGVNQRVVHECLMASR